VRGGIRLRNININIVVVGQMKGDEELWGRGGGCTTIYILVAPCFKNLLRLEAGYPALRCHNLKQNTGHTHNTHRRKACPHLLSDLKKYRRGLVSSELLSETEIIFLLETKGQQPASSFRAACGQGGRAARGARAAGSTGRGAAPAQPPAAGGGPAARGAPAAVR